VCALRPGEVEVALGEYLTCNHAEVYGYRGWDVDVAHAACRMLTTIRESASIARDFVINCQAHYVNPPRYRSEGSGAREI
jgi:hypothetical protein